MKVYASQEARRDPSMDQENYRCGNLFYIPPRTGRSSFLCGWRAVHERRANSHARLEAKMPISGDLYPFTEENVNKSPDQPGVYALYQNAELTYYGMSQTSVRSRLQRHHAGAEGPCTKAATHYRREITTAAEAPRREQELLLEYQRLHGRLPRCNDRTG